MKKWIMLFILINSIKITWAACTVSTTQAVNFGNYNPFSLLETATTGTINVACNGGVVGTILYQISLDRGLYGTLTDRQMAYQTNRISYNLYVDLLHALIWGDGTSGTNTVPGTCILVLGSCSVNSIVYGRMVAQQNVSGGSYTDTVTVTVTY